MAGETLEAAIPHVKPAALEAAPPVHQEISIKGSPKKLAITLAPPAPRGLAGLPERMIRTVGPATGRPETLVTINAKNLTAKAILAPQEKEPTAQVVFSGVRVVKPKERVTTTTTHKMVTEATSEERRGRAKRFGEPVEVICDDSLADGVVQTQIRGVIKPRLVLVTNSNTTAGGRLTTRGLSVTIHRPTGEKLKMQMTGERVKEITDDYRRRQVLTALSTLGGVVFGTAGFATIRPQEAAAIAQALQQLLTAQPVSASAEESTGRITKAVHKLTGRNLPAAEEVRETIRHSAREALERAPKTRGPRVVAETATQVKAAMPAVTEKLVQAKEALASKVDPIKEDLQQLHELARMTRVKAQDLGPTEVTVKEGQNYWTIVEGLVRKTTDLAGNQVSQATNALKNMGLAEFGDKLRHLRPGQEISLPAKRVVQLVADCLRHTPGSSAPDNVVETCRAVQQIANPLPDTDAATSQMIQNLTATVKAGASSFGY